MQSQDIHHYQVMKQSLAKGHSEVIDAKFYQYTGRI